MCGKLFGKHLCTYTIELENQLEFSKVQWGSFFEHKQIVFGFIHSGTTNKYLGIKIIFLSILLKIFSYVKKYFSFIIPWNI